MYKALIVCMPFNFACPLILRTFCIRKFRQLKGTQTLRVLQYFKIKVVCKLFSINYMNTHLSLKAFSKYFRYRDTINLALCTVMIDK